MCAIILRSLLYHDVIEEQAPMASGFGDPIAQRYKLTKSDFSRHLDAIAGRTSGPARRVTDEVAEDADNFALTFDDGGISFLSPIADMLEERGWFGHFFITTDRIGTPGFLKESQIRELAERGHVIGSHSCSHPKNIASLREPELRREWQNSVDRLSQTTGQAILAASIPGGYYSQAVAQAAETSGIRMLFTSEPRSRTWQVGKCILYGRYSVVGDTSAEEAAGLALGAPGYCWSQSAVWNAKKVAKRCLGGTYRSLSSRFWNQRTSRPSDSPTS